MNDSKIPVRYAKALLELTEEKKITEKVYNDILLIDELIKLPDVRDFLLSPVISSGKKNTILLNVISRKLDEITVSFLTMVFTNKRENYLESITRDYITGVKSKRKIKTVEITTAIALDTNQKENFRKQILKYYKGELEFETKVNADLVGGFIIQVDDLLYDASVKRQLRNIQNTLIKEKL